MTNNKQYRSHNITQVLYLLTGWIHSPKLITEFVPIIHYTIFCEICQLRLTEICRVQTGAQFKMYIYIIFLFCLLYRFSKAKAKSLWSTPETWLGTPNSWLLLDFLWVSGNGFFQSQSSFIIIIIISALYSLYTVKQNSVPPGPWCYMRQKPTVQILHGTGHSSGEFMSEQMRKVCEFMFRDWLSKCGWMCGSVVVRPVTWSWGVGWLQEETVTQSYREGLNASVPSARQ